MSGNLLLFLVLLFVSSFRTANANDSLSSAISCAVAVVACDECDSASTSSLAVDLLDRRSGSSSTFASGFEYATAVIISQSSLKVESEGRLYVLTNYHVVDGKSNVYLNVPRDSRGPLLGASLESVAGRVEFYDIKNDLALLSFKVDTSFTEHCSSVFRTKRTGEILDLVSEIYIPGNTLGMGMSIIKGNISALRKTSSGLFYQLSANVNYGNSGSPVISRSGEILGIIKSIFAEDGVSLNIGFAIPSFAILDFLDLFRLATSKEERILDGLELDLNKMYILSSRSKQILKSDFIYAVNNTLVHNISEFRSALAETTLKGAVQITVKRNNVETDVIFSLNSL